MKVCVLGGTGYLGSKVILKLVEIGVNVLCLKRFTSDISRLKKVADKIEFCDIDVFLESNFKNYEFDVFLNFSCKYLRKPFSEVDIINSNFVIPMTVFLHLKKFNLKRIISINTGLPKDFNIYTKAKSYFSDFVIWYCSNKSDDTKFCDILMENFYGEDEPIDRFIPSTVLKLKSNEKILLTDGFQSRDFIYIDDAVNAIVSLFLNNDLPKFISIPIGSGESVKIREFITYLHKIIGSNSNLCFGAVEKRPNEPNTVADLSLLKRYGTIPIVKWQDGLKKFL